MPAAYRLPATTYRLPSGYRLLPTGYLPATGYYLPASNYRLASIDAASLDRLASVNDFSAAPIFSRAFRFIRRFFGALVPSVHFKPEEGV